MSAPRHRPSLGDRSMPQLNLVPGTLLIAVGPAASGKSTYAETTTVDIVSCLDTTRQDIAGDAGGQFATPAAVARQHAFPGQHLTDRSTLFLDSTNVEVHMRAELVEQPVGTTAPLPRSALPARPQHLPGPQRPAALQSAGTAGHPAPAAPPRSRSHPARPAPRRLHRRAPGRPQLTPSAGPTGSSGATARVWGPGCSARGDRRRPCRRRVAQCSVLTGTSNPPECVSARQFPSLATRIDVHEPAAASGNR